MERKRWRSVGRFELKPTAHNHFAIIMTRLEFGRRYTCNVLNTQLRFVSDLWTADSCVRCSHTLVTYWPRIPGGWFHTKNVWKQFSFWMTPWIFHVAKVFVGLYCHPCARYLPLTRNILVKIFSVCLFSRELLLPLFLSVFFFPSQIFDASTKHAPNISSTQYGRTDDDDGMDGAAWHAFASYTQLTLHHKIHSV